MGRIEWLVGVRMGRYGSEGRRGIGMNRLLSNIFILVTENVGEIFNIIHSMTQYVQF